MKKLSVVFALIVGLFVFGTMNVKALKYMDLNEYNKLTIDNPKKVINNQDI